MGHRRHAVRDRTGKQVGRREGDGLRVLQKDRQPSEGRVGDSDGKRHDVERRVGRRLPHMDEASPAEVEPEAVLKAREAARHGGERRSEPHPAGGQAREQDRALRVLPGPRNGFAQLGAQVVVGEDEVRAVRSEPGLRGDGDPRGAAPIGPEGREGRRQGTGNGARRRVGLRVPRRSAHLPHQPGVEHHQQDVVHFFRPVFALECRGDLQRRPPSVEEADHVSGERVLDDARVLVPHQDDATGRIDPMGEPVVQAQKGLGLHGSAGWRMADTPRPRRGSLDGGAHERRRTLRLSRSALRAADGADTRLGGLHRVQPIPSSPHSWAEPV